MRTQAAFLFVAWLIVADIRAAAPALVQAARRDNEAWFFFDLPPAAQRFDLKKKTWLTPVSLVGVTAPISAAAVTPEAIYVAFTNGSTTLIFVFNADGTGGRQFGSERWKVTSLQIDGNLLIAIGTSIVAPFQRVAILDRYTGGDVGKAGDAGTPVPDVTFSGISIAPGLNRLFALSPKDGTNYLSSLDYTDDAAFSTPRTGPSSSGDVAKTWISPDGTKVVSPDGAVFSTKDFHFVGSLQYKPTDVAFQWDGTFVAAVKDGSKLVGFPTTPTSTPAFPLKIAPTNVFIYGDSAVAFAPNIKAANGVDAQVVPLAALFLKPAPAAVDASRVSYAPDSMFVDKYGTLNLFSKAWRSVFRWDPWTRTYLDPVPLSFTPDFVAYSESGHEIFTLDSTGLVQRVKLGGPTYVEQPFVTLPKNKPVGLAVADDYVFAITDSGASSMHWTFGMDGTRFSGRSYYLPLRNQVGGVPVLWSRENQRLYFPRDRAGTTVVAEELNTTGQPTEAQLRPGMLGAFKESPQLNPTGLPLSLSPDGAVLLTQAGARLDGKTLQPQGSPFYPSLPGAVWGNEKLYTILAGANSLAMWQAAEQGFGFTRLGQRSLPWKPRALLGLPVDDTDLVLAVGYEPSVQFAIFNAALGPLESTPLPAPTGLKAEVVETESKTQYFQVECDPTDGADYYLFQSKMGADGDWRDMTGFFPNSNRPVQILFEFPDPNVRYYFRVKVFKGKLSSAFSREVSAIWELSAPAKPVITSAVVDDDRHVVLTWDPVPDVTIYVIQRRSLQGGSGDWEGFSETLPGKTTETDTTARPGGSYSYRVIAWGRRDFQSEPSDEAAVSIPALPGVPTPTPVPPKPDGKPPTVMIVEGTNIVTPRSVLVLHARAADNRSVAAVEFSVASEKRYRNAKRAGSSWEIRVPLKDRLTYVRVRARDTTGNYSRQSQAVIFRSGR